MDTRESELLSQRMHQIADSADPDPELGHRLAERALRGAARRRTARITGAAVAATAVVTGMIIAPATFRGSSVTVSSQAAKSTKPAKTNAAPGELPANTPEQLAIVRACIVGDPSIFEPMDRPVTGPGTPVASPSPGPGTRVTAPPMPRTMTGPGTRVADFRYLASTRQDSHGRSVLLGSTLAHRVCDLGPSGRPSTTDRIPHQTANLWNSGVPFNTFPDGLIFDEGGGGQLGEKEWSFAQVKQAGWESYVGGRTAPGVARITLVPKAGKTLEAAVTNRFFIVRNFGSGLMPEGPPVPATVKLYAADGHLLKTLQVSTDANLFR